MGLFDKRRPFRLFAGKRRGKVLENLVQRIEPKATRDDVILPEQALERLDSIVERSRNRGDRGTTALFIGESGTGKTMAAEVIANQLGQNLFRVDLSAVVNKYIGETEKHLRLVFDAAEREDAIILFDEADALFGKRSEVKDSHDRYANVDINYLWEKLEDYPRPVIFVTNRKENIDPAFIRRLRFIVDFPFTDESKDA